MKHKTTICKLGFFQGICVILTSRCLQVNRSNIKTNLFVKFFIFAEEVADCGRIESSVFLMEKLGDVFGRRANNSLVLKELQAFRWLLVETGEERWKRKEQGNVISYDHSII